MTLSVNDFSFFNVDVATEVKKMKSILDNGDMLELHMTHSTSLNEALCEIIDNFDKKVYVYNMYVKHRDNKSLVIMMYKKFEEKEEK